MRINAQQIDKATSIVGSLCLRADHIVEANAAGRPVQTLVANTIDSISVAGIGKVHIVSAIVGELKAGFASGCEDFEFEWKFAGYH